MANQRIKGQEVSLTIVADGNLQTELTDIRSFDAEVMIENKEEGYLGEKSDRFDEIYKGAKGSFEIHMHSGDYFDYMRSIIDRAQRNTPDVTFSVAGTMFFPSGETRTMAFNDITFGGQPINVPARADYVSVKIEFYCSEIAVVSG